jgi:hypothetical protein
MQFREQGKKIQCIRSAYDQVAKRSHQKVIAAFDRFADKLPSAELSDLTTIEQQELKTWFEARQSINAEHLQRHRVVSAASTLAQLAESIKVAGTALNDVQAAAIWSGLANVGKALRRSGYLKPRRANVVVSVLMDQPDLLSDVVGNEGT